MHYDAGTGIYMIRNTTTGAAYIGSTLEGFAARWGQHLSYLRKNSHPNRYLQNAWNKYGEGAFVCEIAEYVIDRDELIVREQYWIDVFRTAGKCYNLTPAGKTSGRTVTSEQKEKARILATTLHSDPEYRAKYLVGIADPDLRQARSEAAKLRWARPKFRADIAEKASKTWDGFIAPDGTEYRNIRNLKAFCREHGLLASAMIYIDRRTKQQHHGWTRVDRYDDAPPPRERTKT